MAQQAEQPTREPEAKTVVAVCPAGVQHVVLCCLARLGAKVGVNCAYRLQHGGRHTATCSSMHPTPSWHATPSPSAI